MSNLIQRVKQCSIAGALLAAILFAPSLAFAQTPNLSCQDHENVSPALIAQAQQRLQDTSGISLFSNSNDSIFPAGDTLGLSTTGKARGVVIRVNFPASEDDSEAAHVIPETETDEELLHMFNDTQDASSEYYPYESLHAYLERSSLGKLDYQVTTVVTYTAQHPRSYYESLGTSDALFCEALAGVDDQVDFTQCDANNDGFIDSVYLQFAGPCGSWGSMWWPQMEAISADSHYGQMEFDGKRAHAAVLFCTRDGSTYSYETERALIIHETGHVLGLPDLYSYDEPKGPGTGSFDMMENNVGEQNGLFKWMLGWITPEDITYVRTTGNGIDVRQGMGEITHYSDAASVKISPYTSNTTAETGGFVAVSSDETILTGNLFCSFYLLQYDHAAGNQAIRNDFYEPLGHGIRAFRVQASLSDDQASFKKTNTHGSAGKQLYEILNPQEGGAEPEFGAFMHQGTVVSPTTTPSSNYNGSQEAGYSGITFEIVSESDDSAEVVFSWTPQSGRREFTVTQVGNRALDGFDTLQFTSTWAAPTMFEDRNAFSIVVDGKEYDMSHNYNTVSGSYDPATGNLILTTSFNPGTLHQDSVVEFVIKKGFFNLGIDEQGNTRVSNEIRTPLNVATLTEIESSGNYEQTATHYQTNSAISNVVTDQNECGYFLQTSWKADSTERTAQLIRLSEDGKDATATPFDPATLAWGTAGITIQLVDLGDGTAYIHSVPDGDPVDQATFGRNAWVDLATGAILATETSEETEQNATFFSVDTFAAFVGGKAGDQTTLTILKNNEGTITTEQTHLSIPEEMAYAETTNDAGDGYVYAARHGQRAPNSQGTLLLYRYADILASTGGTATSCATIKVENNLEILDVKIKDQKAYIACRNWIDPTALTEGYQLLIYSLDGTLVSSTAVSPKSNSNFSSPAHLEISEAGIAAWLTYTENRESLFGSIYEGQVIFIDPQSGETSELGVQEQACGTWLKKRWIEIGVDAENITSAEHPYNYLHWSLTCELATNPDPHPDPSPKPASDTATTSGTEKSATSKTGDNMTAAIVALIASGVVALATSYVAARKRRHT